VTKNPRGHFPVYLEDRGKLVPMESVSLLLRSDYVRRSEMTHVYCVRGEENKVVPWLIKSGIPEGIMDKPKSLV